MIFNGYDFHKIAHELTFDDGMLAPISNSLTKVSGKQGSVFSKMEFESRIISSKLLYIGKKVEDPLQALHEIAPMLYANTPKLLRSELLPDRAYMAILNDAPKIEKNNYAAEIQLEFIAPDPFAYGKTFTYPLKAIDDNELHVSGSWSTHPIFSLVATGGEIEINNITNGSVFVFRRNFTNGIKLEIDCYKQKVLVNNKIDMLELGLYEFPTLELGVNYLSVRGATGTVTYTERLI